MKLDRPTYPSQRTASTFFALAAAQRRLVQSEYQS